ncbi:cardioacceleratory peptide receptor-like [Saccostrea echinata]|uniref:cardioacceleratory peptide receptor-like n=1 Tax=Saccostrea echinata TaxID=191078 RepID=UPI002A7FEC05|nr:cardioacceleratory peptide receptor-like [Saccostrea echinata]
MNDSIIELSNIDNNHSSMSKDNNSETYGFSRNKTDDYDPTPSVVFLATIFPFMVVGNIVVLTLILRKRGRKNRMDILFANTACADLSVALFLVLSDLFWHQSKYWYIGTAMCKLVRYFSMVATYSSNYAIVVLSIDRCLSVARPMQSISRGVKSCRVYIGISWGLSFLFSIKIPFLFRIHYLNGPPQCGTIPMSPTEWQIYITLGAIAMFLIPAIIITICYTIIVAIVWKNSEFRLSDTDAATNLTTKNINSQATVPMGRHSISRAKIKSIKMTFGIVIAFIVSWSPYFIFNILVVYGYINVSDSRTYQVSVLFQTFAPINSAVNPVIFLIFNGKKYFKVCKKADSSQIETKETNFYSQNNIH